MIVSLAGLCCIVPIATVIVCATWSMQTGLAPHCFPLLDGCLSISAACRPVPVIYLFRAIMLPMSLVLVLFWLLNHASLKKLLPQRAILLRTVLVLSVSGSIFLSLYVIFLGTDGRIYEFLRRLGIYVFFGGTGIAQLLITFASRSLISMPFSGQAKKRVKVIWHLQLLIVLTMLLLGPVNLILKQLLDDSRAIENIIEWNFGLIMFCWYGFQALNFRQLAAR